MGLHCLRVYQQTRCGIKKIVRSRASLVGSRDGAIRPDGKISTTWYDHMLFDAERTGLWLQAGNIESGSNKASLVFENRSYPLTADAVNQLLSIGEVNLPRRINRIDLLVREDGMVGPTIEYFRHSNRQLLLGRTGESGLSGSNIKIAAPRKIEQPTNITDYNYPRLSFGADIAGRMQFF